MKFKVQVESKAAPCRHLQGTQSLTLSQLEPHGASMQMQLPSSKVLTRTSKHRTI